MNNLILFSPLRAISPVPALRSRLQNGVRGVSHFQLVSGSLDMKITEVFAHHHGQFGAMAKSHMAAVGHIGKFSFLFLTPLSRAIPLI